MGKWKMRRTFSVSPLGDVEGPCVAGGLGLGRRRHRQKRRQKSRQEKEGRVSHVDGNVDFRSSSSLMVFSSLGPSFVLQQFNSTF